MTTRLARRFGAFVAERYPFALGDAVEALEPVTGGHEPLGEAAIDAVRSPLHHELTRRFRARPVPAGLPEPTPGPSVTTRLDQARTEWLDACDGFLRRAAIEASLTADEHREILGGMLLTRATDNRLKAFFASGEVRYRNTPFQGKGFRSLGQEAIYAAALRLRRGDAYQGPDGRWTGDVIGPVIRDLGVALAMRPEAATVRMVLNAQMGKAGAPFDGQDLHIGGFARGIVPAAAPLGAAALAAA